MIYVNKDRKVYSWTIDKGIYFRGYIDYDSKIYKANDAINMLLSLTSSAPLDKILPKFNGLFSIIIESNDRIVMAVDKVRSMPLFYSNVDGEINISDSAYSIVDNLKSINFDSLAVEEYKNDNIFVGGNNTLIKQVKQVQASEIVEYDIKLNLLNKHEYFTFMHGNYIEDECELNRMFLEAYDRVAKNLVKALDGRKAVIPLSGGADSRMVVSMLKSQGYKNVLCFTYGKEGNRESLISKAVAKEMDYDWIMFPYTKKLWRNLRKDINYASYKMFSGNLVSTPHIQDYLAVRFLHENNIIPPDSVFVPGHSGDLIAGSHILKEFLEKPLDLDEFYKIVLRKFYKNNNISNDLKNIIENRFTISENYTNDELASVFDWYNIKERQAKYIINSVRAYEHFGYEWLLPLWDNELFDFWKIVPTEQRFQRKLYFNTIKSEIKSTNDDSIYKNVSNNVRQTKFLRIIARRLYRLLEYFNSKFYNEAEYKFIEYFKAYLKSNELFSIIEIYSSDYLKSIESKYEKKSNNNYFK